MALGRGQTTEVGAYANQRLNLAKLGRPMEEMPWFRTGPGKTGRPGLSGGPAKRSHGGIVNPPCNRKGKCGNPAPTAGARGFYPNPAGQPGKLPATDKGVQQAAVIARESPPFAKGKFGNPVEVDLVGKIKIGNGTGQVRGKGIRQPASDEADILVAIDGKSDA